MTSSAVEVAVVGGGLAGSVLVHALCERGIGDIAWFDADGDRGSDVPCALVHPFAGRSFRPRPGVFEAWAQAQRLFARWSEAAKVHRAPLRRMWSGEGGRRLRASWPTWRASIEAQLGADFILEVSDTAIVYGPVLAFEPAGLIAALHHAVADEGIRRDVGRVASLQRIEDGWTVQVDGRTVHARHVMLAAGPGVLDLLPPDTLALEIHRGTLRYGRSEPLGEFLVDGGHVASSTDTMAWGSSYGPPGADPDAAAFLDGLESRLRGHGVSLPPGRAWSGVRVVDPSTRLPWVGTVAPGLHLVAAFGSQGGLWIPACVARFVDEWATAGRADRWPSPSMR